MEAVNMANSNKSISDRLKWLKPNDPKMTLWFRKYARTHHWIGRYSNDRKSINDQHFCKQFILNWSIEEEELNQRYKDDFYDMARGRVNLLKSAWRSHSSKNVNSTFSLTPYSKKRLGILSTKGNVSKTRIVESLISLADDINHLEGELRKLIKNSSIKDINIKDEVNFLNDIINNYELHEESEYLNNKLRELTIQIKQSKEECVKYQEMAEKAQSDLDEYLNS